MLFLSNDPHGEILEPSLLLGRRRVFSDGRATKERRHHQPAERRARLGPNRQVVSRDDEFAVDVEAGVACDDWTRLKKGSKWIRSKSSVTEKKKKKQPEEQTDE